MIPAALLAAPTSSVSPVPVVIVPATVCISPVGAMIPIASAVLRAAATLTDAAAVRLIPPEPTLVIAELTLILLAAFNVRLLALFQLTASLTLISPSPARLTVPELLRMVTLVDPRLVTSVAALMSPPVGAIVKSTGSISQVPDKPLAAAVLTLTLSAIFK